MGSQPKFAILTNELRRRMEVLHDKVTNGEKIKIVDKFTQQLVNSDYNWKQCNDIVTSALKGYERKEKKRKELGQRKFKKAAQTLRQRIRNKFCSYSYM